MHRQLQVGSWLYRPDTGEVVGHGRCQRLEPRVAQVLNCLINPPGDLVRREDILDCVWRDCVVGDEVLTRSVSLIRSAFNDRQARAYVQTLPKRGYRFVASVSEVVPNQVKSGQPLQRTASCQQIQGQTRLPNDCNVVR